MLVTIEKIHDTQIVGKDFKKREFIGEDRSNPQYPVPIKFEVVKDKCELLDKFAEGEEVEVSYNIRGNRWTNPKGEEVIFNSFQVWKIEPKGQQVSNEANPELSGEAEPLPF